MGSKQVDRKIKYVLTCVALVLLVLLVRISYLQLVQTEQFRTLARNNYIRIVPVFAPRGEVFDRNGEKIVTNRPIYTVSVNDLNIEGTTYRVVLERVGADTVQMAEQLARVLAGDSEYLRQAGDKIKVDGDPEENARLIVEKIKEQVRNKKTVLENGRPIELAVIYDPAVAAGLSGPQWETFGVRVEKKTDTLSRLVATLFPKGVFVEDSQYAVERRVREEIRVKKAYESVLVAEDVPLEAVVELREKQLELPGVVVDIQPTRDYPHDQLLSHALGYVQNIKSEQYEQHKDEGYLMNDLYGQSGLELAFERYLRGVNGARQVEVDTYNRPVRDLGLKQPVPGNDLVLTVDLEVQKATEKALAEGARRAQNAGHKNASAGAAVVLDVNTGAVLAMASYPSYNPGVFAGLTTAKWQELQENGALLNRPISLYPPGSTFKMVTAAAILENNVVDPEYKMPDPGYFMLGRRFNDWKPGGHGNVDLRQALMYSCDTYFYRFGLAVGVDAIAKYAREFGLGEKTGIELPGEESGIVPSRDSKVSQRLYYLSAEDREKAKEIQQRYNELLSGTTSEERRKELFRKRGTELRAINWELDWHDYDTVITSIGQGDNLYTPLQLASYVAAIANGGTLYKPYLVDKIISPAGELIEEFEPEVRHRVNIKPENLKVIQEGMHLVTVPPNGTAASVFSGFKQTAAAKTGTAEVIDASGKKKDNHALFVAYAPYEKPEIAVAVILENGYSGGGFAGPIARNIMDAYFGEEPQSLLPPGQAEQLEEREREQEQVLYDRVNAWRQVPDDIPALAWPGLVVQSITVQEIDELYSHYEKRIKRLQAGQQVTPGLHPAGSGTMVRTPGDVQLPETGPEDENAPPPQGPEPGETEPATGTPVPEEPVPPADTPPAIPAPPPPSHEPEPGETGLPSGTPSSEENEPPPGPAPPGETASE